MTSRHPSWFFRFHRGKHMTETKLDSTDLDEFHASLDRCTSQPGFLERFYRSFLAASPEIKAKFKGTNWLRQYRMMVASFHLMSLAAEYDTEGDHHLHRIAHSHGDMGHMVTPEHYGLWLESLIEAVGDRTCP